jgi:hypothetical protein
MKPDICIYHAPCQDGFGAAWAVWHAYGDQVKYLPGVYGHPPPDVTGKHVLIVDFSYKLEVLRELGRCAASITILDHHKSARADLASFAGLLGEPLLDGDVLAELSAFGGKLPIQAEFDMDRSGAVMAWEFTHTEPCPRLLLHVQDRDLWRFELFETQEIAQNLFSLPYEFDVWTSAADAVEVAGPARAAFVGAGKAIHRQLLKDVGELRRICQRRMTIGGVSGPVANMPYTLASEAAGQMAEGEPFAATYYDNADGRRIFSLRSRDGGMDVSTIASSYGGGGHAGAAGFAQPWGWEGDAQ